MSALVSKKVSRDMSSALLEDLRARGLVFQIAGEDAITEWLDGGPRALYCGFDPTADSLHIGSLVPLLMLRRFQDAGHRPLALVGGATGLIGDPSFKAAERQLNTPDIVARWTAKIRQQVSRFIRVEGEHPALVVNNLDWTEDLDVLTFLRDLGKHFSINSMIQKESVRQRLERQGSGISFTEFTYMILQSFDFSELYQRYQCGLQIGGSDQWGNITGGIDLTRRLHGGQVFGLTMPLITKADGTKFGKTEAGTVCLDPSKTSPYSFYQFWLSTADADVYKFLRYFTFLPVTEIAHIEADDARREGRPAAQAVLAREVTRLVHGDDALIGAQRITDALFNGDILVLSANDLEQLALDGLPTSTLDHQALPATLAHILTDAGLASSGKQVKDALGRGAILVNGEPLTAELNNAPDICFNPSGALHERYWLVRLGKKKVHLFIRADA